MGIRNIIDENELRVAMDLIKESNIPSPPRLLLDLKAELAAEEPNEKKILDWILKDIGLASSILKTVNSPLFGLDIEISSIEHAVNLLGLNKLKNYIIQPAYRRALNQSIKGFDHISKHSHSVGLIAELIAKEIDTVDQGLFYLAGLFHDAGILVIADKYPASLEWYKSQESHPITLTLSEKEKFQVTHSSIGVLLAKQWGLPNHVCNAIYLHHHIYATYKKEVSAESVTIAAVLKLANYLNHKEKLSGNIYSVECNLMYQNALEELMFDEQIVANIEGEINAL
ncbi:MAG: HDOD domain-containing protein [gamma proteobacterium symbiont of Taylorina sp.]|nr:HDOD domain-containing protein [gamma proteobacterium symbiont of Taylorina sp.]